MRPKFKSQSSKLGRRLAAAVGSVILLAAIANWHSIAVVRGHGGVDDEPKPASAPAAGQTLISIVTAERNIQNESGNFNLVLKRSPGDVRARETEQFLLRIAEKVEGGFGGGEPVPIEKASIAASITRADGTTVKENLPVTLLEGGNYRMSYAFASSGDYKIAFAITTEDNRNFSVDFPVSVLRAPTRWSFWIGLLILALLCLGTLGLVFYELKRKGDGKVNYRRFGAITATALLIFALGTFGLAYLLPPSEIRVAAEIPLNTSAESPTNTLATATVLTVSKESQILFGIKTEPVQTKKITSGLKTTGVVRARPDARALVSPQVAGKIVLRDGISLGAAVTRGEQIGTIEQVLDVSTQSGLESQRLEVQAQQREVEAKRLELKNTILQLQGQQADQRAKAQQARTQLAQAQREMRRSQNLVEVGAAPKKRLEEAQTAVKVAEQEASSAEQQVKFLDSQIKQTQGGQVIFRAPTVNQPTRFFPLTAPVTGIINEIKATSGQQLEAGAEILSIVNLSTVLIEANVFERDLPVVRESTRASFTSAALSGEVYTIGTSDGDGRIVSIGQTVNEQTRTVLVIYEVINPLGRLRDGMFVEIMVDTSGEREVLAVPKRAVVTEQGQTFVFVFTGGETFEKRAIALGAEGADYYEVKTGLKEGERVVTEGIYQLRSTQPGT